MEVGDTIRVYKRTNYVCGFPENESYKYSYDAFITKVKPNKINRTTFHFFSFINLKLKRESSNNLSFKIHKVFIKNTYRPGRIILIEKNILNLQK